jgi:hypothetical protein
MRSLTASRTRAKPPNRGKAAKTKYTTSSIRAPYPVIEKERT